MPALRSLRRDRNLTITELARRVEAPARILAHAELGLQPLDPDLHRLVAAVLDVEPSELVVAVSIPAQKRFTTAIHRQRLIVSAFTFVTVMTSIFAVLFQPAIPTSASLRLEAPTPAPTVAQPFAQETHLPPRLTATPTRAATAIPTQAARPATLAFQPHATSFPTPDPSDAPRACPLLAASDRIIITQGYDTGTHAPASVWGALDLAIDTDHDGISEPDATRGIVVLATSAGIADVTMDSWPGGNFVRITNQQTGWSSAYAHLDSVAIADGQQVSIGMPIGTVGTTGQSSGPHLHYEIWHGATNLDPSPFLSCGRAP